MPRLKLAFIFSGQSSQEIAIVLLCLSGIGFPSVGRDEKGFIGADATSHRFYSKYENIKK